MFVSKLEHDEQCYTYYDKICFRFKFGGSLDAQAMVWILDCCFVEIAWSQFMVELRQLHWVVQSM